jgi:hypothetical protein
MGWFSFKKRDSNSDQAGTISRLLDDLTHLEINTIIKAGMTAAPPPDSIEETLQILFNEYKDRMSVILVKNDIGPDFGNDFNQCRTFHDLHTMLLKFRQYMDANGIRLIEFDYIRVLRMISFCEYIFSKSKGKTGTRESSMLIEVKTYTKDMSDSLYDLDLSDTSGFRLIMDTRDRVKLKRLFDLGTENIVMQTRFGLDGDVVTRVEENFANRPRQLVIDLHDKHTQLSINYWKNLVGLVQDIVSKIIK